MSNPCDLPPLRDVIAQYGLDARRSLGQHFLLDQNLTARIARTAGDLTNVSVIEVGPGPGGLTRSLLAAGARSVIAIEKDARAVDALSELSQMYPDRLMVIRGDALSMDIRSAALPPRKIIANLPYNISTPLLLGWLRNAADFVSMTLMFQREVANRLTARPGTKSFGRLSVITQWLCEVRFEFGIDARAFVPPPKVASALVTLATRAKPLAPADWSALERVTQAAFGQRRKMLRSSLKPLGINAEAANIDPALRAEDLDVEAFCALARLYANERQDQ